MLAQSSLSRLKPFGNRGGSPGGGLLQAGQGAPAAPQVQACGPVNSWSGWLSQTNRCPRSKRVSCGRLYGIRGFRLIN